MGRYHSLYSLKAKHPKELRVTAETVSSECAVSGSSKQQVVSSKQQVVSSKQQVVSGKQQVVSSKQQVVSF